MENQLYLINERLIEFLLRKVYGLRIKSLAANFHLEEEDVKQECRLEIMQQLRRWHLMNGFTINTFINRTIEWRLRKIRAEYSSQRFVPGLLRTYRERKHLSRRELASQAEVRWNWVGRAEYAQVEFNEEERHSLARHLGCSPDNLLRKELFLFSDLPEQPPLPEEDIGLLKVDVVDEARGILRFLPHYHRIIIDMVFGITGYHYTQEEAAVILGVSRSAIGQYENRILNSIQTKRGV